MALTTAVLVIAGDRSRPQPHIAYIGSPDRAEDDKPFQNFRRAFATSLSARHGIPVEYVPAELAALDAAVRSAAARGASVLVTPTGSTAAAARRVAPQLPGIFASYLEPVRGGFVDSLDRPGHARTGISLADTLDDKRIEILKDAYPNLRRIAVLADHDWVTLTDGPARVAAQAQRSGLSVTVFEAETVEAVERLLGSADTRRFDAWYVAPTYITYIAQAQIIDGLRRIDRPAMFSSVDEVRRGGTLAYSQDTGFVWPALVALVDRVLDGEDPGTIPVERPRRFILAVRVSDVTPGRTIDPAVVRRADQIF